ncbi:MAG TPA: hypothetical protein VN512_02700 [Clostridia bacterium]|nr:hypothetical protein [Clostridia bacterium]
MAVYKVSYSMLSEQGEELKKLAKLVDGYVDRVNAIKGRLGSDALLEQVRANLTKLSVQLGESRTVLNTAGGLLVKTVESYSGSETRQVKKVDSLKAHNRDFYKNPVVVASAGGAAAATGTVLNYTDNSTTINNYAETGASAPVSAASAVKAAPISAASTAQAEARASQTGIAGSAGIAAATGVAGGVAGAGIVEGALHLKGKKKRRNEQDAPPPFAPQQDDLDARLVKARERARRLNEEDD